MKFKIAFVAIAAVMLATIPASAQSLGVLTPLYATITQGGAPNYADTYVTPYVFSSSGMVFKWKANFPPGNFAPGQPGVPASIQLKIFRSDQDGNPVAVSAGQSHDPRTPLQQMFPGYPFWLQDTGIVEFTETSVNFAAGDYLGVTIRSDPAIGAYFYTLVSGPDTRLVLRDVAVGETIDLSDPYTGILPGEVPAIQLTSMGIAVSVDIKPGSYPNAINLGSAGVVPVAILSTADFDARTVDPESLKLAGASVGMVGKSNKLLCSYEDVNGDQRLDLVCKFTTADMMISTGDSIAEVVGMTYGGSAIKGQDSVKIVP